jgi:hypothetical protein
MSSLLFPQGRVDVRFTDASENIELGNLEYQMVETTAYFESYRHILEGLKVVQPDELPFQVSYLVIKSLD